MKLFSTLLAASALVFGAQAANAQTFDPSSGTFVFEGDVTVAKDMGEFNCKMRVTVNVTSASTATATASLAAGDWVCPLIGISGTGTVTYSTSGAQEFVTLTGLTITPPLSSGVCNGPIKVKWFDANPAGANPSRFELEIPLSNSTATAGADCKMSGVLPQVSPASPQLQIN